VSWPADRRCRDWTFRTIDPGATAVIVAGRLLLATGQGFGLARGAEKTTGLVPYSLDGERRFALFEGRDVWVEQVVGRRAYVNAGPAPLRVVDLARGRVIGTRPGSPPMLLLQPAWSWSDEG
jgi:hypothetical protein